jgi:hypothetical protein
MRLSQAIRAKMSCPSNKSRQEFMKPTALRAVGPVSSAALPRLEFSAPSISKQLRSRKENEPNLA